MFENLQGIQKHVKIPADEIHIRSGVQYQGGPLIGFSVDEPEKPAKNVLAFMLASLMGHPAFVIRLIPIFPLKANFLFDQIIQLCT